MPRVNSRPTVPPAGALRLPPQTEPDNVAALALYTAAGFQRVEALVLLNLALVP